jgi:hypothetical protein
MAEIRRRNGRTLSLHRSLPSKSVGYGQSWEVLQPIDERGEKGVPDEGEGVHEEVGDD